MSATIIFYIIIGILIFDFILDRLLDYLNSTKWSAVLPPQLVGIYDEKVYSKQQEYEKENHRFSQITDSFQFVLIMLMLFLYGFAWVDQIAKSISVLPILNALLFFGILMFAADLLGTPFAVYDTFVIEEKYGFNKTTVKTFILDKLKGWGLAVIIGGGLLSLIIWFYMLTGKYFWIYTWFAISTFSIFMALFYSTLIVPLFNKQTPLQPGELRDEIESFSKKVKFKLDNIFMIDGSKRSTKANAYFSGLGPKKRIVLFDTMLNDLEKQEITAVLAHEIGHYKKKHIISGIAVSLIHSAILLYIFSLLVDAPVLSEALGAEKPAFHLGLITFGVLYSPISLILDIIMNIVSRRNEYQADRFASNNYIASKLGDALKKLSVKNLSNLMPHAWYVFFHYSHPTLLQRLQKLTDTNYSISQRNKVLT
ncbi:MAG: M48 family metallopeptidase [Bacteroidia bacterium]|nr:M48 family metallopeptidase [Bacteroidia bacterium]